MSDQRRTMHGFPCPSAQVYACAIDDPNEAVEVIFGYWKVGVFSRHMSPTEARNLAASLTKAADYWESRGRPAKAAAA